MSECNNSGPLDLGWHRNRRLEGAPRRGGPDIAFAAGTRPHRTKEHPLGPVRSGSGDLLGDVRSRCPRKFAIFRMQDTKRRRCSSFLSVRCRSALFLLFDANFAPIFSGKKNLSLRNPSRSFRNASHSLSGGKSREIIAINRITTVFFDHLVHFSDHLLWYDFLFQNTRIRVLFWDIFSLQFAHAM